MKRFDGRQLAAETSVDARGSWYFRVVELLDIVRVELELQASFKRLRCRPAPARLEKLAVIQTQTFINKTKTTVCGIPSN